MSNPIENALAAVAVVELSEAELSALASSDDAAQRAVGSGDVDAVLAALEERHMPLHFSERTVDWIRATLRVRAIPGPFTLWGASRAIQSPSPPIEGGFPFPAVCIGTDGLGTEFHLLLHSGNVISLHHDATYFEEAKRLGALRGWRRIHAFSTAGSSFSVEDLMTLQARLPALLAEELDPRARKARLGDLILSLPHLPTYEVPEKQIKKHPSCEFIVTKRFGGPPTYTKQAIAARRAAKPWISAFKLTDAARARGKDLWLTLGKKSDALRLSEVPLDSVVDLNLTRCGLAELPPEILEMPRLEGLTLTGNRLEGLPEGIGRLKRLQRLYLRDNRLTSLPASFAELSALRTLDLTGNRLGSMPGPVARLPRLEALHACNNEMGAIEDLGSMSPRIRSIEIRHGNALDEATVGALAAQLPFTALS